MLWLSYAMEIWDFSLSQHSLAHGCSRTFSFHEGLRRAPLAKQGQEPLARG